MYKIIALFIGLVFSTFSLKADEYSRLSQSFELMELCKTQPEHCELLLDLAKDNILFAYSLGAIREDWRRSFAELVAVPQFSCVESVTSAQLRDAINESYGNMKAANLGAATMIFNALGLAAAHNCARTEV